MVMSWLSLCGARLLLGWLLVGGILAARQCVLEFRARRRGWGIFLAAYAGLSLMLEAYLLVSAGWYLSGWQDVLGLLAVQLAGAVPVLGLLGLRRHGRRNGNERPLKTWSRLSLSLAAVALPCLIWYHQVQTVCVAA